MDNLEMNQISGESVSPNAIEIKSNEIKKFCKYIAIILTIAVISLVAFHGSYFLAKYKDNDFNGKFGTKTRDTNVRLIQRTSGKATVFVNNFNSDHKLNIYCGLNNHFVPLTAVKNSTNNRKILEYITHEVIDGQHALKLEVINNSQKSTIGLIKINDIINGKQFDDSIVVNSGLYTLKLTIVWRSQ